MDSNSGFKQSHHYVPSKLERINLIDVIWHNGDKIVAEFEVEHSTSIVDAIIRGSNIEDSVIRIIVIPEEREDFVSRKFSEPAMKDMIKKNYSEIMTYDSLSEYFEKTNRVTILTQKNS
jgi:hypothetical protein